MDFINDYIFDGEYVLLAEDGSTSAPDGSPIVQYIWGKNWVNNHAHIILPKERRHIHYTFLQLKSIPAKMMETGSIQKKISQENLLKQWVVVPSKDIKDAFEVVVTPLWEEKKNATEQINSLLKQRDGLLPLLMNGQVSVMRLNNHLSDCREECPFHVFKATKSVSLLCASLRMAFTRSPASRAMVCCWSCML